jgi:CheY-like chemotaxis protein
VVDADPALFELLQEWLAGNGCAVCSEASHGPGAAAHADAIIVDVPFPRHGGLGTLRRIEAEHPATPIIVLSPTFFTSIDSEGTVARKLGVAAVLPSPVRREALIEAVARLLSDSQLAAAP